MSDDIRGYYNSDEDDFLQELMNQLLRLIDHIERMEIRLEQLERKLGEDCEKK